MLSVAERRALIGRLMRPVEVAPDQGGPCRSRPRLITATAVLGHLRRQLLALTGFAAGVLLLCDVWFDVVTAHGADQAWSLTAAALAAVPLAVLLITGSLHVLRLVAARLWVLEPGDPAWPIPIPLPSTEADRADRRTHHAPSGAAR